MILTSEIYSIPKSAKDVSGTRFGRLVAIIPTKKRGEKLAWLCRCDCGNLTFANASNLGSKNTTSCGCFHMEQLVSQHTTHGRSRQTIYRNWGTMIQRCTNSKMHNYSRYGGRGILVHGEWQQSFEIFYAYVSNLPHFGEEGRTLDRVNNDGNYEPGNVRWSTSIEQARNSRSCRLITYKGKTMSVADWARELGINYGALRSRLRYGWATERAFETPVGGKAC